VALLVLGGASLAQKPHPGLPGMGPGGKMPSAASLDPAVKNAESGAEGLEKKLKAKPSDSKLKMATAEAWYKAGFACEYSKKSLPAKARYRTALKHYRRALALNPNHAGAKKEKDQIEQIYRGMPGGIPK